MIKTETSVYINRVKFATKQIKNYSGRIWMKWQGRKHETV